MPTVSLLASPASTRAVALSLAATLFLLGAGCKSSKTPSSGDAGAGDGRVKGGSGVMCSADAGGPIAGDKDMHCIDSSGAEIKVVVNEAACSVVPAGASSAGDDAGAVEEAPVLYGSEGDDDDCKYHLKWTATCIERNKSVTFNVTVTKKADGKPLTGANPDLEVSLTDTHFAPNTKPTHKETAPGVYTVGPIQFDAAGKWTVRFHLRETCVDTAESPHGHAAFYVNVP